METMSGGYSLDDLRRATDAYVAMRTKIWRGVCWHKPDTTLYLDWDDETLYQVGEVLSCPKTEAECVLKLLKAAGVRFIFAIYSRFQTEAEDNEEDEEFDDDGWLVDSEDSEFENKKPLQGTKVVGQSRRYLGVLNSSGLRRQTQIVFGGPEKIFFPADEIPIVSEYALAMLLHEKKRLSQVRFLLRLQIYYLVALAQKKEEMVF